jgi:four helix bundle protein
MKYSRFEELPAWNTAIDLAVKIYKLTAENAWAHQGSLRDQIQRASVSVSNNIAEGFERGTTQELLTFLYIARGSAGEVRSMLCLLEHLPAFFNLKSEISNLKSLAENISRQLAGWASSMQETPIQGPRYLTQKVRRTEEAKRGQKQFLDDLKRMQESFLSKPGLPTAKRKA